MCFHIIMFPFRSTTTRNEPDMYGDWVVGPQPIEFGICDRDKGSHKICLQFYAHLIFSFGFIELLFDDKMS